MPLKFDGTESTKLMPIKLEIASRILAAFAGRINDTGKMYPQGLANDALEMSEALIKSYNDSLDTEEPDEATDGD